VVYGVCGGVLLEVFIFVIIHQRLFHCSTSFFFIFLRYRCFLV
jgi:hypothetical protein